MFLSNQHLLIHHGFLEEPESIDKLRRAGSDKVISPTQIGGYQLAMAMLKPVTVDLVDTLFTFANEQLQIEELSITESSPLVNQSIFCLVGEEDSKIRVIALIRNNQVMLNIHTRDLIQAKDTLILLGASSDLEKIEY